MTARLGLGLAALGRPEYLNLGHAEAIGGRFAPDALERHCHDVLDAAWQAGVRHLDAARSYGLAERFLGSWFARHPGRREAVVVGSKWGYAYVADFRRGAAEHEVKEHSPERLSDQWPQTLEALGSAPDHYLVHSVTPDSPALHDAALLDRLVALRAEGVRVGLSTSGPAQAEVVRQALRLDVFDSVQCTWNPLEPSVGPALAQASAVGWFVVVKEAMANGRLAGPTSPLVGPARDLGASPDALALALALAQPWADVVLSGAATVEQLVANSGAGSLDVAGVDARTGGLAEPAEAYWGTRSALAWT